MTRFDRVLFYADDTAPDPDPVAVAVERARLLDARLTFVAVVPARQEFRFGDLGAVTADRVESASVEAATETLDAVVGPHRGAGVDISTRVLVGDPASSIVRAVLNDGYQMVWKAPAKSARLRDRFLGSVDMRLIRVCPCPVAIVGTPTLTGGRRKVIAAIDVTSSPETEETTEDLNRRILDLAVSTLNESEVELHIVHAWSLYGESMLSSPRLNVDPAQLEALLEKEKAGRQAKLEELLERYRCGLEPLDLDRFKPELHLVKGDAAIALPKELQRLEADILVMGTMSRTGIKGLLIGNTAEKILYDLECSVVVTKSRDFVSPVLVA